MSTISTNPFATGFSAVPPSNDALPADAGGRRMLAAPADSLPPSIAYHGDGDGAAAAPVYGADDTGGSGNGGLSGFESIMNGFINGLQNMLASLGQTFGLGGSSTSGSTSTPPGGETYFSHATASSVGDPHDSFAGTTGSGSAVGGKWDSMKSHGDLLGSNSFDGGYRVSTTTTAPTANGVTLNASATVTTDGGNSSVSMNGDGSYAVTSNGAAVSLTAGQPVSLDNGETVTLNADKSLTVDDRNGSGGTIATTLRANGDGGVDVSNTANDVDLGGYLVDRSERGDGGSGPRRLQPLGMQNGVTPYAPLGTTNDPYASDPYASTGANDGIYLA